MPQLRPTALACCAVGAGRSWLTPLSLSHAGQGWPGPYSNGTGAGLVNASVFEWATENLPLFEISDPDIRKLPSEKSRKNRKIAEEIKVVACI